MNYSNLIPLTEASFYILISLLEPLHGYGIIQKIEEMSSGRLKLGPGTLYGALNNLTAQGLIERVGTETGRRKNYQITRAGRELITLEINRLEELIFNAKWNLSTENQKEEKND